MAAGGAPSLREALRAGRWFRALPVDLQDRLLARGILRSYGQGARLFARGDPPSGLFAVVEGAIRITAATDSGREALLTIVEPPAWFGEIALFDGQPRTHDAIADDASRVLHVPDVSLAALLAQEPRYWRDFALLLTSKLRLAFLAMEDAAVLPAPVRLARRLAWMCDGYGDRHDRELRVVEVSQEQLALMLATSRQTVNQLLRELEGRGWVRLAYGRIEILDLAALRRAGSVP